MSLIARFKRDIAKHRGRSAVLAMLFVGFVGASIKMVFDLRGPQTASAATFHPPMPADVAVPAPVMASADAEDRIEQSKKLWQTLREVKPNAASADVAFAFDASYYPPPPPDLTKHASPATTEPAQVTASPKVDPDEIKRERILEQSRSLILKTTAVGNGTTPPMAIINQQLLTIGQEILGFELTAIRAREVECIKEGVTVVVKMPEGQ